MRILMFCRYYYPHIGGVERHVEKISKIFFKRGFEVVLFTEKFNNNLPEKEVLDGIKILRVSTLKHFNFLNKFVIWFKLLIKHFKIIKESDIIHCHDIFFWYLPFKFIFPSKKVFTTFHGYEKSGAPSLNKIFWHKISELLSSGNIAVGAWHKKWYKVDSDIVIYGAGDIKELIKKNKRRRIKNTFCFVGRLDNDTGIMTFLKVLEILKKYEVGGGAVVCGDGPLKQKAILYSIRNKLNVKFLGIVNNIGEHLGNSKYVFTSGYLGIIEAFLVKRLVFAVYDSSMKKDYLEMTPFRDWIIKGNSPSVLAKRLRFFVIHPLEEKKMVEKAYNWAKEQTWEKVADLYLKLWGIKK